MKKGYPAQAKDMFKAILRTNPDYRPDPIRVPPDETAVFEQALKEYKERGPSHAAGARRHGEGRAAARSGQDGARSRGGARHEEHEEASVQAVVGVARGRRGGGRRRGGRGGWWWRRRGSTGPTGLSGFPGPPRLSPVMEVRRDPRPPLSAMGRGAQALVLAVVLLALPATVHAAPDPVIYANAQLSIILNRGPNFTGTTPMAVAYHEGFHTYYGVLGGSPTYSAFTFDSSGSLMYATTPINVDSRGMFYNPSTGGIEVVPYSAQTGASGGLINMGLSNSGILTATNNQQLLASLPGLPDVQSAPRTIPPVIGCTPAGPRTS